MIESIIEVKERVERKVPLTNIKIRIAIDENNSSHVDLKECMDKKEKEILTIIKDSTSSKDIRLSDSSLRYYQTDDGLWKYRMHKTYMVDIKADVAYLNTFIVGLLQLKNPPDISWEGYVENIEEIEEELLAEAITNSKKKAEYIASALGKRVLGVKRISDEYSSGAAVKRCFFDEPEENAYDIEIEEEKVYVDVRSEWYI